ncbi:hypothetical protein GV832_05175 [Rhodobacteraceae bacterium CYK-10]|uniref:Uncharacterized protein n=1 Tax=Stagnihabitans tardus TaxID=2699202 RepID=A0AAE4YBM8_9RHOB|nr:hypothetical protein [Stagnihabitans tardus]
MLALGLSVAWILLGVFVWYGTAPEGLVARGLALVSVVVPVAMIWVLALSLDQVRLLRAERERLQMVMDQMRLQAANAPAPRTAAPPAAAAPAAQARAIPVPAPPAQPEEAPRLTFQSRREGSAQPRFEEQPGLGLDAPEDMGAPLGMEDFLRAIHFPDGPEDVKAFAALKLALADRLTSKLIQASQDVLNLLAEDGIYMDDLAPDRAKPELWRKFAAGERGRAIAALGGIRDRSCLALTAARMREDEIFRDVAHHFLRSFDKAFVAMEPKASDAQLSALSDTRTARAFMLFGRVTGTFD